MSETSYQELRDSKSKIKTVIGVSLIGLIVLVIGVGLINAGLTAQACSGGVLGFFQTCVPRVDYSLIIVGIILIAFSAPIFLLALKTYSRPEVSTNIREMRAGILSRCSYCKAMMPSASQSCPNCGAKQR